MPVEKLKDNLRFLETLDKKLSRYQRMQKQIAGGVIFSDEPRERKPHFSDEPRDDVLLFNDVRMNKSEIERIIELMNKRDFAITPENTGFGFDIGFGVYYMLNDIPGIELEAKPVLRFIEKQLPKGYTWKNMSDVFTQERNRELLRLTGLPEPKDKVHYKY